MNGNETLMEFKDALTLYFERSNAMQVFWNFYITVNLAIIAFFGSRDASKDNRFVAAIITVAFTVFAIVNCNGLYDVTQQRIALKGLIAESASTAKGISAATLAASSLLLAANSSTPIFFLVTTLTTPATASEP